MIITQKKAVVSATAQNKTKGTYHTNILTHSFNLVKKKVKRISRSFWVASYNLETARQDHAARGHLWRQIGYCIVLLAFRLAGKVVR